MKMWIQNRLIKTGDLSLNFYVKQFYYLSYCVLQEDKIVLDFQKTFTKRSILDTKIEKKNSKEKTCFSSIRASIKRQGFICPSLIHAETGPWLSPNIYKDTILNFKIQNSNNWQYEENTNYTSFQSLSRF